MENVERLHEVREQLRADLHGTLSWVRKLVTMIHLAHYTGAPASRAEELVAQIAATVEGLSEVTHWKREHVEDWSDRKLASARCTNGTLPQ